MVKTALQVATSTQKNHSPVSQDQESKYRIEEKDFASGSYGTVSLARDASGKQVVIKRMGLSTPNRLVLNEVKAGTVLGEHPNIAKFHEYFLNHNGHHLVIDYVRGIDLYKLMEATEFSPLYEDEVKRIFKQILNGLDHAHKHGVAHRDIKLENIIVDSNQNVKLIDFGLSTVMDSPVLQSHKSELCDYICNHSHNDSHHEVLSTDFVGSDNFVAPEILKHQAYCPFKADIWSLGIVLYCLLFGRFPWNHSARVESIKKYGAHPRLTFSEHSEVSDSARDLLTQMLKVNPLERFSLKEVMNSEWLSDRKHL